MQPLFFIPDAQVITEQLLRDHGLWTLVNGGSNTGLQTFNGPGGVTGIIIAAGKELGNDDVTHVADKQSWSKRHGYTSLVGTWNDRRPSELELRRPEMMRGGTVRLLDGNEWTIPTLRRWRPDQIARWEPAIPRVLVQDYDTGKWAFGDILPEYSRIWETSLRIAEDMITAGDLDWDTRLDFAAELLGINYRVDKSVITHLQLLTIDNATEIIRSALDWSTLENQIKKEHGRRSGGTNSECGAMRPTEESSTRTVQP